jgi:hypothetical protein
MTNASRRISELKFRSSGFDCFRRKWETAPLALVAAFPR